METLEEAEDDEEEDKEASGEEQLAQPHLRLHHCTVLLIVQIVLYSKIFLAGCYLTPGQLMRR